MNRINIKKIEQEIELELISSMKRNLKRHLKEEKKTGFDFPQWQAKTLKEMKRFQRENISIVREKTEGLNNAISKQLQNELKQGSKRELKKYKKVMGSKYAANKSLSHSFFKLNDRKLTNLIDEVQNGTKLGNYGALRMMDDQYRKVIAKAAMFSNYGAVSPKKAIDMATKDFLNAGINCIEYKNGRRVNIADYCDMALRTANTRAQLIGEGQFRQEIGEHLVKPTRHNTSCEKCAKWEGKILIDDVYSGGSKKDGKYPLLSEAMAQGFFHPRCEHSLSTYYKEVEYVEFDEHGPTEATMKQYQEDLNRINNNIQRYERLVAGSLDEENVKEYSKKVNKFKSLMQKVINDMDDLKTDEKIPLTLKNLPKEYHNEIINIINNAPPTIQALLKKNENQFKFKNIKSVKTARYSHFHKNIKLNLKVDRLKGYKTLFHEMSHQLDHILGNISQDSRFEHLIIDDFNRIKSSYMLKYNVSESIAYNEIGNMLKKSSKANSVSDIISGITKNKCVGNAFHKNKYWEIKGKIGRETFAHFGSALIRRDAEELDLLQQFFPSAYEFLKDSLKRSI